MQNLLHRLEKRGWSKRDITKTVSIIKNAKRNKSKDEIFLEKRIYWILLIVIIVANFAISVALIPILIGLRGFLLYFAIITLGIIFGLSFELVIRSMGHLERKHHIFLAILIPLIALANIFIISKISNELIKMLNLINLHNPIIVSLIYSASFVLPYIIYKFILKIEYYKE